MSLYDDILVGFGTGFGNKVGKLYSLKPTDGTADFDATRTGTATRVNQDKLIESQVADLPRADFGDFDCPTLLLEPASENFWLNSENVSIWGASNVAITPDTETAPDGKQTADGVTSTVDGAPFVSQNLVVGVGDYTFSGFVKKGNTDFIAVFIADGAISVRQSFNIGNGTVGTAFHTGVPPNYKAQIFDFGNGWYRCTVSFTVSNGLTTERWYLSNADGVLSASVGDYCFIWGGQSESIIYPTSYIPTEGASVSRGGDLVVGEADSKNISSEKGILFAHIAALVDDGVRKTISLNDGTTTTGVNIRYNDGSNVIRANVYISSVFYAQLNFNPHTVLDFHKVAVTWEKDNFKLYANGILQDSDNSGEVNSFGTLDRLNFAIGVGSNIFYGKCKEVWHSGNTDFDVLEYTAYSDFDELVSNFKYNIQ